MIKGHDARAALHRVNELARLIIRFYREYQIMSTQVENLVNVTARIEAAIDGVHSELTSVRDALVQCQSASANHDPAIVDAVSRLNVAASRLESLNQAQTAISAAAPPAAIASPPAETAAAASAPAAQPISPTA